MVTKRAKPSRPPQIVPIGASRDEFYRWLIYSRPGQGKTVLAGTSPRCLVLEADRGTASAKRYKSAAEKWVLGDWNDLEEALSYLRNGGAANFDWVWLDSITLFQERGMDHIMDDLVAEKSHRKVYLPDKGDYGQNMNRLSRRIRELVDLPVNVGIIAHEFHFEDPDTGEVQIMPYVQGKGMPQKICSYVDQVGRMELKTTKEGKEYPVVDFRGSEDFYAKDRLGLGRVVNVTVPKLMAAVSAGAQGTVRASKASSATKKTTGQEK